EGPSEGFTGKEKKDCRADPGKGERPVLNHLHGIFSECLALLANAVPGAGHQCCRSKPVLQRAYRRSELFSRPLTFHPRALDAIGGEGHASRSPAARAAFSSGLPERAASLPAPKRTSTNPKAPATTST